MMEEVRKNGVSVRFYTLGCKLNFAESSFLRGELIRRGFREATTGEKEKVSIINTCSVTEVADKKGRQLIRRVARENKDALIVVTGCYAQLKPLDVAELPNVRLVVGNGNKQNIPTLVERILHTLEAEKIQVNAREEMREFMPACSTDDRTRYFLKVQDGCNYFCTYCTIPFARGRSRNASIQSTCTEALKAVEGGAKEIVLTGVNIGDFGQSTGENFFNLIKALEATLKNTRIRISSIEPDLLTEEMIDFVASSQCFMPHFHIPLQAGSDEVLKWMRRRYDTSLFQSRIEKIKSVIPNAFIGVDVIVGMRGETLEAFETSQNFLSSLPISQLHIFPYSERPNTQALKIFPIVEEEEKHRRASVLLRLSEEKTKTFYLSQQGKTQEVLFEKRKIGNRMQGFTPNYIRVEAPYRREWVNQLVPITLQHFDLERKCFSVENTL